jgi:hypothetical protein
MLERAAFYAATNGFATAAVPASAALDRLQRDLEDRRWYPEGAGREARYVRRLGEH